MRPVSNSRIDALYSLLFESPVAALGHGSYSVQRGFVPVLEDGAPAITNDVKQAFTRFTQAATFAQVPIVGICGLMNSGKSSTTALHLSQGGRKRINIGDTSKEGTHRFVLWMPTDRRDDCELIAKVLGSVFTEKPETLSDDPDIAAAQYNARQARLKEFDTPLMAFDEGLDLHGVGLLDCPDIQRTHDLARKEETARIRGDALRSAARLCSAFYIVASVEQQESSDLEKLLEILGGPEIRVPLYYILTKVDSDIPKYVRAAEERLEDLRIREKVRAIFVSPRVMNRSANGFPQGLAIHHGVEHGLQLDSVVNTFNVAELQLSFIAERFADLMRQCKQGLAFLQNHFEQNEEVASEARSDLLGFLEKEFLDADGAIRNLISASLLTELKESIQRTTPWYFLPGRVSDGLAKWIRKTVSTSMPKTSVTIASGEDVVGMLHHTQARDFRNFLQGRRWLPTGIADEAIEEAWEKVAVHHRSLSLNRSLSAPDRVELDRVTAKMWEDIPMGRKAVAMALVPVSILGALATAVFTGPIDMGGSTVVYSATVAQLFAALGIGGAVSLLSSSYMQNFLEMRAGRPELADLFSLLQDAFGMRRAETEELAFMKNNEKLQLRSSAILPIVPVQPILAEPYGTLLSIQTERLVNELEDFEKEWANDCRAVKSRETRK